MSVDFEPITGIEEMDKTFVQEATLLTDTQDWAWMIQRQADVNDNLAGPDWRAECISGVKQYNVAFIDELIEYQKSVPYAWWSKGEPNLMNMRVELIDALHFGLSMSIAQEKIDAEDFAREMLSPVMWSPKEAWNECVEYAASNVFSIGPFTVLLRSVGLDTTAKVRTWYEAKACLNEFRRANGYKEGTYLKDWTNRALKAERTEDEDNSHMYRMLEVCGSLTGEQINAWLTNTYTTVIQPTAEFQHTSVLKF
jgi:hypothetical protein